MENAVILIDLEQDKIVSFKHKVHALSNKIVSAA